MTSVPRKRSHITSIKLCPLLNQQAFYVHGEEVYPDFDSF